MRRAAVLFILRREVPLLLRMSESATIVNWPARLTPQRREGPAGGMEDSRIPKNRAAISRRPKRVLDTPDKHFEYSAGGATVNKRAEGQSGEWETRTPGAAEQPSKLVRRVQYPHWKHSPKRT